MTAKLYKKNGFSKQTHKFFIAVRGLSGAYSVCVTPDPHHRRYCSQPAGTSVPDIWEQKFQALGREVPAGWELRTV